MKPHGKFAPGQSGNPSTAFQPGNKHRWSAGVSGNPTGKSRYRAQFDEAFNQALLEHGSPEEAAKLLWDAARAGEAWAIQNLCQRFAPETHTLNLKHEITQDAFDYSKLTDEQLAQLEAILASTDDQPPEPDSGDGSTESP